MIAEKKILLKVYTELNLGDDLFLKMILERYPTCVFYLRGNNDYKIFFENYPNLEVFKVSDPSSLFRKAVKKISRKFFKNGEKKFIQDYILNQNEKYFNECDLFVSIGGSIFMQQKISKSYWDIEYYNLINSFFRGKGIFYIGCNFGPYIEETFKKAYDEIFSSATDVCFREEKSFNDFNFLNNVRYHSDVVFGLQANFHLKEEKSVGFSIVSARKGIDESSYISKFVELINYYSEKGYKVFLFSFCKKEGDETIINKIYNLLKYREMAQKIFYCGDIDMFLSKYASVEKMYCGRFHSMILSMIYNQKIYPIIYSEKMTNVLNDIKYQGEVLLIEEIKNIDVHRIYNQINNNVYSVDNLRDDSEKQFYELDVFLKK